MTTHQKSRLRLLVAALRSGEYTQARGRLKTDNGYCCLGVACDVFYQETGRGEWENVNLNTGAWLFGYSGTSLPHVVQDWYGLPHTELNSGSMVSLNDGLKWNFDQIADEIEETYGL